MRQYLVNLALKLTGTPYIYGGSTPRGGFDCSGFVIWLLQVFEVLPSGDWRADGLAQLFSKTETPEAGDLAFYGTTRVSHVMMHLGADLVVGASGGDATTTTVDEAMRRGARVKVKPLRYRSDYLFSVSITAPRG